MRQAFIIEQKNGAGIWYLVNKIVSSVRLFQCTFYPLDKGFIVGFQGNIGAGLFPANISAGVSNTFIFLDVNKYFNK